MSGAKLAVMEPDVQQMEDGGKADFHYGTDWKIMGFPPVRWIAFCEMAIR